MPQEALEAIFVQQSFGLNPPEEQGADRSSPREGRLFEATIFFENFCENVGPLVGSLGLPGGPGKLWMQSLLNKDLA